MNEKLIEQIETLLLRIETLEKEVDILKKNMHITMSEICTDGYPHVYPDLGIAIPYCNKCHRMKGM